MLTKPQELTTGITFDDVLLRPQKTEVTPRLVNVRSKLTRNIDIQIPLLSAPMDTVTTSKLAIALAREGGLGFIHKNMTPREQAEEVTKVKRWRNSFIANPVTLEPDKKIKEVVKIRQAKGYKNIPITNKRGKLLGLITKFDYFWPEDENLTIKKLMRPLKDIVIANEGISMAKAKQIIKQKKTPVLLLTDKQGYLKSIVSRSDVEKNLRYPLSSKDSTDRLRVGAAVSVGADAIKRAQLLTDAKVDVIVIDTAHGHSQKVLATLKKLKSDKYFNNVDIIAGNIATSQAAKEMISLGADAIKVGIGPGSICTTRIIAGIGVPQITAIQEAVRGRGKNKIPIIADGGIRYSGDIVKAIAAGADSVMLGNLFAATKESPGELTYHNGKMYKVYRGMGSVEAMSKGSKDRYGQKEELDIDKLVPEGIVGQTIYKGELTDIVHQLIGGLRAGLGYVGAKNISELQAKADFIKITANALRENHPHDIAITKEPPNYHLPE